MFIEPPTKKYLDIKEKDLDEKIENDNSEDYDEDNNDKIKSD